MSPIINVLIVDDDETDRYIARRQLSKSDHVGRIAEASDGAEAHAMFNDGRFVAELGPHPPRTLVLLDINMPTMSGFDLLEHLQSDSKVAPSEAAVVVILTSSTYFGDRERAEASPLVEAYVEKPLTLAKVESLLHQHWILEASA